MSAGTSSAHGVGFVARPRFVGAGVLGGMAFLVFTGAQIKSKPPALRSGLGYKPCRTFNADHLRGTRREQFAYAS